jgi:hypothetical protein
VGRLKSIEGKTFNWLTVQERIENQDNRIMWRCLCNCGKIVEARGDHLKAGKTKSCGCLTKHKRNNAMQNRVFGYLTVLEEVEDRSENGSVIWKCLCHCGKEVLKPASRLTSGRVRSCSSGCFKTSGEKDLTGKTFGRFKVIGKVKNDEKIGIKWKCLCTCGNIRLIVTNYLISGHSKSCGCLALDMKSGKNNNFYKHGLSKTKEYKHLIKQRRRTRMSNVGYEDIDPKILKKKFKRLGNSCVYCNAKEKITVDHVVPVSRGGVHALRNLVPACAKCNSSKRNKILFLEWQPKILHPELESTYRWFNRHGVGANSLIDTKVN